MSTPAQRQTTKAMGDHLKACAGCRSAYSRFQNPKLCPTGRRLWAEFRKAWGAADDGSVVRQRDPSAAPVG
jgi:hypothetical protein